MVSVMDSSRLILQALSSMKGADTNLIASLVSDLGQRELSLFGDLQTKHIIHVEGDISPRLHGLAQKLVELGGEARGSYSQETVEVEEASIRRAANRAWWVFIAVYLVGGLITLCGSVLKTVGGEAQKS
jgi:hypothetical protein